jgi:integrase
MAGYGRIHSHLNPVRAYCKDIAAAQVNERCIGLYRKYRLSLGRTRATINREVQYLSQALKLAVKKQLLTTAPEIEKYQEKNARQGFFEVEDFERVVPLLPADIQDLVRFGYYSGWRRGEIAQLEWSDVEEEIIRLRPEISKTRDGRILSLVGEIADIIARRRTVRRSDVPWVFYRFRKGKFWPVGRFDKVWRKGGVRAGMAGRLFHDFRRSTV